jgi:hypothetical protein
MDVRNGAPSRLLLAEMWFLSGGRIKATICAHTGCYVLVTAFGVLEGLVGIAMYRHVIHGAACVGADLGLPSIEMMMNGRPRWNPIDMSLVLGIVQNDTHPIDLKSSISGIARFESAWHAWRGGPHQSKR